MQQSVFYSWQSDSPNSVNRGFVGDCLERALKDVRGDEELRLDPCLDRDTSGVPGSPDIAATIFEKIGAADIFVADVTFIDPPDNRRRTPNPNVMVELGYAAARLGWDRIICVFNRASGKLDDLPFDIRPRRVRSYDLIEGQDNADNRKVLVGMFKEDIRQILTGPPRPDSPALMLEFADGPSERRLGRAVTIGATALCPLSQDKIPSYGVQSYGGSGLAASILSMGNPLANRDYFREKAYYLSVMELVRPVSLCVFNGGGAVAHGVRLEAWIERDDLLLLFQEHELPRPPRKERALNVRMPHVRSALRHAGEVTLRRQEGRYKLVVDFGKVQPKACVLSAPFYAGSIQPRRSLIHARLFADNFIEPMEVELAITFDTSPRLMSLKDLHAPLPADKDGD